MVLEGCKECLDPRENFPQGTRLSFRKIYRDELIRRLAAAGVRQKEIAEKVGLSQNRISEIVKTSETDKLQPSQSELTVTAKLKDELARLKDEKEANADKRRAVEMAIRILVEDGKSLHEITGDLIAEMTLVTRQYVNKVKSEIVEQMTTLGNKFQVPEVTKSEAKELTVTQKLKEKVDSLEWKLREAERQKEAFEKREKEIAELKEKHRKESEAASKFEGEKIKLENEMKYLQERIKEIEGKTVEYITPPDVEDELESLRLENSRIAAALEEARKPQAPVALPDVKVVEKEVIVTPPEVEAELKRLRKQYEDEQRLESKKAKLEEDLARLRAEGDNERAKNTFLSLLDYVHGTRTATERIKAMAKAGTLTVEHLDESERLFMAMVAAGNDGMNTVREARGLNAENAGLRVVK